MYYSLFLVGAGFTSYISDKQITYKTRPNICGMSSIIFTRYNPINLQKNPRFIDVIGYAIALIWARRDEVLADNKA